VKLGVTFLISGNRKIPLGGLSNAWNIWATGRPCKVPQLIQDLNDGRYFQISVKDVLTPMVKSKRPSNRVTAARCKMAEKACFRRSLQGSLLEGCGHRPGTIWLPKNHFRQSCFSHVFKELGSDALQIGSYCNYPVTGPKRRSCNEV
jgi:hypothetical protein